MSATEKVPHTYPHGVTCWVDSEQPDPQAAARFYGELFGWTFHEAMPSGAPGSYLIAKLNGDDVAAIGHGEVNPSWNTYISVDDVDVSSAAVDAARGRTISGPIDPGEAGRTATCLDPTGAQFRLWHANKRLGAQVANVPGAWNFSNLCTHDVDKAMAFYAPIFGWEAGAVAEPLGALVRVPGYGDHLESTVDPDIRNRQAAAPPGFADVIGGLEIIKAEETPRWSVRFAVADRDETAVMAEKLDARVELTAESQWDLSAVIRDPQGACFTISQLIPRNSE